MTTGADDAQAGPELEDEISYLRRSKVDSRRILVESVPYQLEPAVEVWVAELSEETSGEALPLALLAELGLALRAGGAPAPHVLTTRRTYMDWGASAVEEDILLEVASGALTGVAGGIAYDVSEGHYHQHRPEKSRAKCSYSAEPTQSS